MPLFVVTSGCAALKRFSRFSDHCVVGPRTRLAIEPRHGLEVVVHHVGQAAFEDLERAIHAAAEVRREDLDLRRRRQLADPTDAVDEVLRPAVAQVVAIDARDDDVRQAERRDRLREVERLVRIERIGTSVADVAERAAPRALVAHDHERRGALAEALADVRAARFLADRVQPVLAQDPLDVVEALRRGGAAGAHADPLGLAQLLDRRRIADLGDRDAAVRALRLLARLLLHRRVVGIHVSRDAWRRRCGSSARSPAPRRPRRPWRSRRATRGRCCAGRESRRRRCRRTGSGPSRRCS